MKKRRKIEKVYWSSWFGSEELKEKLIENQEDIENTKYISRMKELFECEPTFTEAKWKDIEFGIRIGLSYARDKQEDNCKL